MAALDTTRISPAHAGLYGRVLLGALTLVTTLIAWNDARRTRVALSKLSDRELWDIGLSRADLDALRG